MAITLIPVLTLTVRRAGAAEGQCIRVTPALYTGEADLGRFVEALEDLIQKQGVRPNSFGRLRPE